MQPETISKTDVDVSESPDSNINVAGDSKETTSARPQSSGKGKAAQADSGNGQFPPPKTDKPRPHVCGTCGRSFARLEHLKRHERSHTKEKPFECPECTRCFARRDLLLRHQQKLHMTNTTSSRPRTGRRESVSGAGVAGGRVRKNSIATGSAAGSNGIAGVTHRPRANTLGHIDLSGLSFLDTANAASMSRMNALGLGAHPMGVGGFTGHMNYNLGNHGLPKLDTQSINTMDISNSLRTAPPGNFGGFDIDQLFSPGTTINPAQLHFGGSMSATQPTFPPLEPFTVHPAIDPQAQVDDFGWMRNWNMHLSQDNNEQAIDESSPSRMSSGDSPEHYDESLNNSTAGLAVPDHFNWQHQDTHSRHSMSSPFQLESLNSGLPNVDPPAGTISPNTLHDISTGGDAYLQQMIMQQQQLQRTQPQQHSPQPVQTQHQNFFQPALSNLSSDSPSISASSITGSAGRQSSVTSMSTDSITEATRHALLMNLAQASMLGYNQRKHSQPCISSPLSPSRSAAQIPNLPSTDDIRKYVDAFIQFAHPHLPFVHISTLSFEGVQHSGGLRGYSPQSPGWTQSGKVGSGCLILGMAAIGALYEYDHPAANDLFDAARKLLERHLEELERRKVNSPSSPSESSPQTPLWLVQALLLNVIYGHQCGDKKSADAASSHCIPLVRYAREAELTQPSVAPSPVGDQGLNDIAETDVEMRDSEITPGESISRHQSADSDLNSQWLAWKEAEERKRTLFAIFIVSSLLTTAYNHTPTIMNSEILLDLPCDEELWSAETAQEWQNRGGLAAAEQIATSFATALSTLLTSHQRHGRSHASSAYNTNNPHGALQARDTFTDHELRPSTFGCLVLINAIHNYIWETRSRHHGRQWTAQETESMFSHIEPALSAWMDAWRANDSHNIARPNPHGAGPLSADSIPLLDLAYVRLFVNLGRTKEAFWQRDFDAMANELARGSEIVHAEGERDDLKPTHSTNGSEHRRRPSQMTSQDEASSRRERHLRKAAFYAADCLSVACKCRLTYADMNAHELPVQSAMCFFDCSQVLAEWACTLQERVGSYLGVLGRDPVNTTEVPAIILLQPEDIDLMEKIRAICESMESKRFEQESLLSMGLMNDASAMNSFNDVNLAANGYGSQILRSTALMLEKAVVWPVTHVMAKALETQAAHMDTRASASVLQQ